MSAAHLGQRCSLRLAGNPGDIGLDETFAPDLRPMLESVLLRPIGSRHFARI